MGIERTITIAGINVCMRRVVGHDIDGTSQGISTEIYGYDTLIYLNAVGKARRYIVDAETG